MKKQVVHLSIHQTSKVIAAMHAAMMTALVVIPSVIGYLLNGQVGSALLVLFVLPLFFWLLLYVGYVIACWFYNLVVPWTGGIELEVKEVGPALHEHSASESAGVQEHPTVVHPDRVEPS